MYVGAGEAGVGWGDRQRARDGGSRGTGVCVCVWIGLGLWPSFIHAFAHVCVCLSVFGILQACACILFISVCFVSVSTFVP